MKEKDFQTFFGKNNKHIGVFELKLTKGKSIPFSALADHQEEALRQCAMGAGGYYHKITDQPVFKGQKTRFTRKKPFDCFRLKGVPAFVVVMFWVPRRKKSVYYIKIQDWVYMRMFSKRKSATEEMCKRHATHFYDYFGKGE